MGLQIHTAERLILALPLLLYRAGVSIPFFGLAVGAMCGKETVLISFSYLIAN